MHISKNRFPFLLSLIFYVIIGIALPTHAQKKRLENNNLSNLQIWDNQPATDWMTQAYPMGNGSIGGMVFGGVNQEHIQFNENSLWTGDEQETGAYQAFGDLYIDITHKGAEPGKTEPSNYQRTLDLSKGAQTVTYSLNQVKYKREYFCSYPDKVMVLRFTATKKGTYSAVLRLQDAHQAKVTNAGTAIQISGNLDNNLSYLARTTVKTDGGTSLVEPDGKGGYQLRITNANAITVFLAAATNYSNIREKQWRGEAPQNKVTEILRAATSKKYTTLLKNHLQDYQNLFGRVSLRVNNAGQQHQDIPTKLRLQQYKANKDTGLEALLFQYGRYLLISSSRPGGLPANLQGLWNNSNNPPWRSDYHSNINVQMNYWPAQPANLAECHMPYLDWINSLREVKKANTQKEYPGVRGWTVKTENNIFGGESFVWNTPGSAWFVQDIWEYYAFTKDLAYLKNTGYAILKEITEFWDDHLKRRPDGTLVAPMGWSPEHGPREDGVSHDQQIIYDLFTNYVAAADVLQVDKPYRDRIAAMKEKLLGPKIGRWGQLQEWETDRDDPNDKHRHVSHLFALHPGKQISTITTPELAKAAKVSLQARGDASTGWSMAWKINFWARLQDGNHAYKILQNFITPVGGAGVDYNDGGGLYANLFCAHPPFQIDGNFGYVAGVSEMLVQSQTGIIQLLPALPQAWASGQVKGLRTRGNFEIENMEWQDGKIVNLSLKSISGGECEMDVPNTLQAKFKFESTEKDGKYRLFFNTEPNRVYHFTSNN